MNTEEGAQPELWHDGSARFFLAFLLESCHNQSTVLIRGWYRIAEDVGSLKSFFGRRHRDIPGIIPSCRRAQKGIDW
jgi:hypothetical protein